MFWFFRRTIIALMVCLLCFLPAAQAEAAPMNLLLIGVDSANAGTAGRSDTMLLMRISEDRIQMVSFLRDLYVDIPGHGKNRLNAAYFYGGEELLKKTLRNSFGVEVDRTATVHFQTLAQMVDELGGVEVDVAPKELPYLNRLLQDEGLPPVEKEGLQRLNGMQALCYSRLRKLDSDFHRTARQQTVITAMLKELSHKSRWELLRIALGYLKRIDTDLNFGDLVALAPLAARLDELTFQTAHVPFEGAYTEATIDGMMVLKPDLPRCRKKLNALFSQP